MADGRLFMSMLLDFYGEMLTPRQRECFDLHYNEDLSLAEIAEQCGISRQGAWDNIKRAEAALSEMEEKTGLIRRFSETQKALGEIRVKLEKLALACDENTRPLAQEILCELEKLRTR